MQNKQQSSVHLPTISQHEILKQEIINEFVEHINDDGGDFL